MDLLKDENELLYRAVLPSEAFWSSEGRLSSAAFKCRPREDGISADRQGGRAVIEVVSFMRKHLRGSIVSVSVGDVIACDAVAQSDPSHSNAYHSLIKRMNGGLSASQAKKLANVAQIIYQEIKY